MSTVDHVLYNGIIYSKTSMARTPLESRKYVQTGVVRANEVNHSARSGGIIGISFRFSLT